MTEPGWWAGVLKNERVIHISRRGPAVYKWEVLRY